MGLDSVSSTTGLKFNVRVFDTDRSITKVERLIGSRNFEKPDVIVGPFFGQLFESVARYGYRNCVPVISPTARDLSDLNYNDHLVQVLPDKGACLRALGQTIARLPKEDNFLLVHYGNQEEVQFQWDFRQGLTQAGVDTIPRINTITLDSSTVSNVRSNLRPKGPNHVIILTEDEANVAKLMRNMLGWLEDHEVIIYGPENWGSFKNVDNEYFDQLRLHRPEVSFIEFENDTLVREFNLKFRQKFESEPSVFAFRGFDIALAFLPKIKHVREHGIHVLADDPSVGLQMDLIFEQDRRGHWINQHCGIVRINDLMLELAE